MATGTVKWFSDEKGRGFITPDDQGKDLFVRHTGIAGNGFKSLAEGARVSYERGHNRRLAADARTDGGLGPVNQARMLSAPAGPAARAPVRRAGRRW
jgi:CspA family cold shock protein